MEPVINILFIVNPISGTSRKRAIVNQIDRTIDKQRFSFSIINTEYPGHARLIAKEAANKGCGCRCRPATPKKKRNI